MWEYMLVELAYAVASFLAMTVTFVYWVASFLARTDGVFIRWLHSMQ